MQLSQAVCLTALLFGSASSCSGGNELESEGLLTFDFEVSSFLPCGSQEGWWVVATDELFQQYQALNLPPGQSAFARLRGDRSGRGEYGHLNSYPYEFEVTEVVTLRPAQETDC